jgi:hypothetical protein
VIYMCRLNYIMSGSALYGLYIHRHGRGGEGGRLSPRFREVIIGELVRGALKLHPIILLYMGGGQDVCIEQEGA